MMTITDEACFIRAIAERPDDDVPRLIFADWLDEHGDPARAEFIRVQCDLARLSPGPRWLQLSLRESELLALHGKDWLAPLAGWVDDAGFRRGLIEKVTMLPFHFTLWAEVLFRLAPVRDLHFYRRNHVTLNEVEALARSPYLARLASFKLNTDRGIRDDAVKILAATPALAHLSCLDLSDNWIGDPGAVLLAESSYLDRINLLKLGRNRITRRGKRILLDRFGDRVTF